MAKDILQGEYARRAQGITLTTPITVAQQNGTPGEITMAHELGHQVDADRMGPGVYQIVGFVLTQRFARNWTHFEDNADARGGYYGIEFM